MLNFLGRSAWSPWEVSCPGFAFDFLHCQAEVEQKRFLALRFLWKFLGRDPQVVKQQKSWWIDRLEDVTWTSKVTHIPIIPPKKRNTMATSEWGLEGCFPFKCCLFSGFQEGEVGKLWGCRDTSNDGVKWCKLSLKTNTHRIHVWYNYLYNPSEFTLNKNQM